VRGALYPRAASAPVSLQVRGIERRESWKGKPIQHSACAVRMRGALHSKQVHPRQARYSLSSGAILFMCSVLFTVYPIRHQMLVSVQQQELAGIAPVPQFDHAQPVCDDTVVGLEIIKAAR
jgi:hypothetical protein